VTIKKFTSVGSNVVMGLGKHPTNMASTHPAFYSNNKGFPTFADKMYFDEIGDTIVIGNDVWIGYGAIIMSGVSIGDGSIVAAGAIVTKNVIPYSIVGGVPARLLKMRFDEETIEKMLKISWWDYSLEDIAMNFACFHDVKKFIRAFSPNATHTGSKC
jgi:acetyltransferase-like isoleucine patch superfamily enzyme